MNGFVDDLAEERASELVDYLVGSLVNVILHTIFLYWWSDCFAGWPRAAVATAKK